MTSLFGMPVAVIVALVVCALAVGVVVYLLAGPRPKQLEFSRRRPGVAPPDSTLTRATAAVTTVLDRFLRSRGSRSSTEAVLELAGIRMRPQDFLLILIAGVLSGAALGAVLGGLLPALLLALLVPVAAKVFLGLKTSKRQRAFEAQLDDAMQMLAGNLRAGHSLLQALDAMAREAPAPLSEEFTRVINETRVGRDAGHALEEVATRMNSKDMTWIAHAITINRNVGGNLAEVLDQVGATIRERGQIKRQVQTLSAEGRLSAIVLMVLPIGVAGFLLVVNPGYLAKFSQSLLGYGLLVIAAALMVAGGVWLRKVTILKF
ncbi:type II secretion system F family protein [Microlunatus ginsengisoli]|uniref:Type II secretion system protein GspF domain-containing protein n=1 Tax=Microlunatus ginsengisoli TaxID=363863 RepID=A0ABP7ATB7_9ACTN